MPSRIRMIKEILRVVVKALGAAIFGALVDKAIKPRSSPTAHQVGGYTRKQAYGLRSNPRYRNVHVKQHTRGSGTKV